jgi:hypothetical protein
MIIFKKAILAGDSAALALLSEYEQNNKT